jgi:hypothetical protein
MNIKPVSALSLAASSFMFVSSLVCLILQVDLTFITPLWEAALAVQILTIIASSLTVKNLPRKFPPMLVIDLLFTAAVLSWSLQASFTLGL